MNHFKVFLIGAALALSAISSAFAASVGNDSEGATPHNPVLIGGLRSDGKVQTKTESVATSVSAANVASLAAKATKGTVFWVFVVNGSGATNYIQIHDAATLPANTAIPKAVIGTLAASASNWFAISPAIYCATGIVVAKSTTAATLTAGAADGVFTVGYR